MIWFYMKKIQRKAVMCQHSKYIPLLWIAWNSHSQVLCLCEPIWKKKKGKQLLQSSNCTKLSRLTLRRRVTCVNVSLDVWMFLCHVTHMLSVCSQQSCFTVCLSWLAIIRWFSICLLNRLHFSHIIWGSVLDCVTLSV